jgi:hypothetical protein
MGQKNANDVKKRADSMDLFEKCAKAKEYEAGLKQSGHYFFRRLESPQDSEMVVNRKESHHDRLQQLSWTHQPPPGIGSGDQSH